MSNSGLYGASRLCTGIFGTADLRLGKGVEAVLQAHIAASPNFRGIRSAFPSDLDATFQEGYAMLGKYKLSFDNYSPDFTRLPTLAKLAAAHPDIPVIVNHLGGKIDPHMDDATFEEWKSCLDAVAAVPNCVVKCGGAQQRVGADWEPPFHMHQRAAPPSSEELCDLLFRFYSYAIDVFGPERCMFESSAQPSLSPPSLPLPYPRCCLCLTVSLADGCWRRLPGGQGVRVVPHVLEPLQAHRGEEKPERRGQGEPVLRHRLPHLPPAPRRPAQALASQRCAKCVLKQRCANKSYVRRSMALCKSLQVHCWGTLTDG